jgi:hypothetical protein
MCSVLFRHERLVQLDTELDWSKYPKLDTIIEEDRVIVKEGVVAVYDLSNPERMTKPKRVVVGAHAAVSYEGVLVEL